MVEALGTRAVFYESEACTLMDGNRSLIECLARYAYLASDRLEPRRLIYTCVCPLRLAMLVPSIIQYACLALQSVPRPRDDLFAFIVE